MNPHVGGTMHWVSSFRSAARGTNTGCGGVLTSYHLHNSGAAPQHAGQR